jgi:hypothetical protein
MHPVKRRFIINRHAKYPSYLFHMILFVQGVWL